MERFVLAVVLLALALTGCNEPASTGFISDDKNPWLKKAEQENFRRNYPEAAECYEKALALNPDSADTHYKAAMLCEKLNDFASAIYHYQRYLKQNPDPDRKKMVDAFIERAKRSLAASLPNSPTESANDINDLRETNRKLQEENDKLKQKLAEAEQRLANQPAQVAVTPPPVLEPTITNGVVNPQPPPNQTGRTPVQPVPPDNNQVNPKPDKPPKVKPVDPDNTAKVAPINPTKTSRYTVKAGDTLAGIAEKFYGDRKKYELIYRANKSAVPDKDHLLPGTVLTIPPKSSR